MLGYLVRPGNRILFSLHDLKKRRAIRYFRIGYFQIPILTGKEKLSMSKERSSCVFLYIRRAI